MSVVSDRLRWARERKNLKQTQVKERTGINNKTLSGYENGVSEPDIETLKVLAELYEVSIDWLSGKETRKQDKPINETEFIIKELINKYNIDITNEDDRDKLENIIKIVYSDYKRKNE